MPYTYRSDGTQIEYRQMYSYPVLSDNCQDWIDAKAGLPEIKIVTHYKHEYICSECGKEWHEWSGSIDTQKPSLACECKYEGVV